MADLVTRAQIRILAQLLDVEPERLRSLERLDVSVLDRLHKALSAALFDAMASVFARVSKLAPLVPDALAATVAVKAVPPEVAGRAGGAIGMDHQHRAASLLGRLTPSYLADAAPYVDPRVIPFFAPKLPFRLLVPAADELLRRRDYLTAARFVEYATDELIREFERHVQDDAAILLTGAMVSRTEVLNKILRVAGTERQHRLVDAAVAGGQETLVALLSLLGRIDAEFAGPLSNVLFESRDEQELSRICALIAEGGASAELLDVLGYCSDGAVRALVATGHLSDTVALEQVATTERRQTSWRRLTAIALPESAAG
ncbi:hypothetical protein D7D52_33770 [Nocardia yunnanensis]|uniref:DUF2336 domain-containing protein n=1 Tax=Nocardia yunnanensis TaxID=2382165 RepID=A0A386ZKI9_9NOCA|nr:hypothetical protein [Nocardia yunnanensis]AYF77966.1 hypothetical protein D7D52_33770 [Nocardia yunnanensis]